MRVVNKAEELKENFERFVSLDAFHPSTTFIGLVYTGLAVKL
jgi:hypothetical protein